MAERSRGYAHRVDIIAAPERVWDALVDPGQLAQWYSSQPRVNARSGGSFILTLDGQEREAHIDVFQPPRRLRLIYMHPPGLPEFDGAIVDDFLLEHEAPTTVVRLLGSGIPEGTAWDNYYLRLRATWERALARLKVLAERNPGSVPKNENK